MRKSTVVSFLFLMFILNPGYAQVGNMLKNVKKSVSKELFGKPAVSNSANSDSGTANNNSNNSNSSIEPEPSCACENDILIMEMGKYKIDYTELKISVLDDGNVLVRDYEKENYYIVRQGITEGPYKKEDPKIAVFKVSEKDDNDVQEKDIPIRYSNYITRSGEKLLITFNGKKYGPYSQISKFVVSNTKDKFAAVVTENLIMSPEFIEKYEEAGKKLKTDQERMQLSMKMSEEIRVKTEKYGPQSAGPIYVSNIPGAAFNKELIYVERFFNNIKYGDIVTESGTRFFDPQGKMLATIECSPENVFISSDNRRYACYSEGALEFSDNTKLEEMFNPSLMKEDGKVYLAYMYYSPRKNSIMQCKILF